MAGAVKIGSWGLPSGKLCDINSYSSPQRLINITVYSNETPGGCIVGFSFTYVDQTGGAINVGTWGNTWGGVKTIYMNQGEHVNDVSGTSNSRGVDLAQDSYQTGGPRHVRVSGGRRVQRAAAAGQERGGGLLRPLGRHPQVAGRVRAGGQGVPREGGPLGRPPRLLQGPLRQQHAGAAAEHRRPQQREVRRPRLRLLLQLLGQGRAAHQRWPLGLQDQRPAAQHLHERGQLHHFHQWHLR